MTSKKTVKLDDNLFKQIKSNVSEDFKIRIMTEVNPHLSPSID